MGKKILLGEDELPRSWYNIAADLTEPLQPPLDPRTRTPLDPSQLEPLFPPPLIEQEVTTERAVPIPDEVLAAYRLWRPTPLVRADRWERLLQTPARIYFKYEGVSPVGSHKPNTAVAQAFYNRAAGTRRLTTETGAGQWGSALAFACRLFELHCVVYMVRVSYQQKAYRRVLMELYGAEVIPSPSDRTAAGRAVLADDPDSPGSLGIAISEAVEEALGREDTHYALGSVLNHVMLHQTIIGLEAKRQLELAGEQPTLLVGAVGGGSNFAGLVFPFVGEMLRTGQRRYRVIAAESSAAPSLTRGRFTYDYGDTAGLTPLLPMHTLGHGFIPPPVHAGGLRYHGMAPLVSHLYEHGWLEAVALDQTEVFQAAVEFAQAEGIVPAPESAHAVAAVRRAALEARSSGTEIVVLFNLSGHGHFDLTAYQEYLTGNLSASRLDDSALRRALEQLP